MARIVITRPNGETEHAELTTDKAQAGNDRLTVEKAGTVYYAKLGNGVSTHMYIIKPDGRKLYVQKEFKFVWKYVLNGDKDKANAMVIPRTGKYLITFKEEESVFTPDNIVSTKEKEKQAIFEQGARFDSTESFPHIKARNGDKHWLIYRDSYGNPFTEEFHGIYTTMLKIEYIGEA